jgi:hypothetical protein
MRMRRFSRPASPSTRVHCGDACDSAVCLCQREAVLRIRGVAPSVCARSMAPSHAHARAVLRLCYACARCMAPSATECLCREAQ